MPKLFPSNPVCFSCSSTDIVITPAVCEWNPFAGLWVRQRPPASEEDKSTVSCLDCGADHNAVTWITGEEYINSPAYRAKQESK